MSIQLRFVERTGKGAGEDLWTVHTSPGIIPRVGDRVQGDEDGPTYKVEDVLWCNVHYKTTGDPKYCHVVVTVRKDSPFAH
jgi:hypothetical protein